MQLPNLSTPALKKKSPGGSVCIQLFGASCKNPILYLSHIFHMNSVNPLKQDLINP